MEEMAAAGVSGSAFRDVLHRWSGRAGVDDEFAAGTASAREAGAAELDEDPWLD